MIELKKIYGLAIQNLYNLGVYQIIKILLVLYNIYVASNNQDKFIFYINNYIN